MGVGWGGGWAEGGGNLALHSCHWREGAADTRRCCVFTGSTVKLSAGSEGHRFRAEKFEREVVGSVRARWSQKHSRFLGIDMGFR